MIARLTLVFTLFMMGYCKGHCDSALAIVGGVRGHDVSKAIVRFDLMNKANSKVYYKVSVEKFIEGSWGEIVSDVEADSRYKAVMLEHIVKPKEVRKIIWQSKIMPKLYRSLPGKNRFKIEYVLDFNNTYLKRFISPNDPDVKKYPPLKREVIYSTEFLIK